MSGPICGKSETRADACRSDGESRYGSPDRALRTGTWPMYVVAIDASKDDIEATDYKVFERRKDAEDRFYRAWRARRP